MDRDSLIFYSPDCRPEIRLVTKFQDDLSVLGMPNKQTGLLEPLYQRRRPMTDGGGCVEMRRGPFKFQENRNR
jgi:hypothetical protein